LAEKPRPEKRLPGRPHAIGFAVMVPRRSRVGAADRITPYVGGRAASDAVYHEWLSEWVRACEEDRRRFVADGQKIMQTSARCLANSRSASSAAPRCRHLHPIALTFRPRHTLAERMRLFDVSCCGRGWKASGDPDELSHRVCRTRFMYAGLGA
jgi:hypothetical protein